MSQSESDDRDRIIDLAERVLEGEGNAVRAELEAILQQPDARRIYIEYLDMHARMADQRSPTTPRIVAERLVYERVEIGAGAGAVPPLGSEPKLDRLTLFGQIIVLLLVGAVMTAVAVWMNRAMQGPPAPTAGTLTQGVAIVDFNHRRIEPGQAIPATATLRFQEDSAIETPSGYVLQIKAPTMLILNSPSDWKLDEGAVRVVAQGTTKQTGRLHIPSTEIRSRSGSWRVETPRNGPARLIVESGEVEVKPARHRPRHYWSFDAPDAGRTKDETGGAEGVIGDGAKPVQGLVGPGALDFNNSRDAFVAFGGGGQALGTGSFAMDQAVSIETLFVSRWSGRGAPKNDNMNSDAEVLFRKQDPGNLIMLLQFKNYHSFRDADPKIDHDGPAIAFGLYLVGSGYKELTVPLDGVNGRPAFAAIVDGKVHHIVATYDSRTGVKALYLDGRLIAEQRYTPGTRILSGGPGKATAGNHPTQFDEPFTGILDEMAVYDIPLSPFVVADHWMRAKSGRRFFDGSENARDQESSGWIIAAPADVMIDRDFGFPVQK